MINLWGGTLQLLGVNDSEVAAINGRFKVGKCSVSASHLSRKVSLMLQKDVWRSNEAVFEKGTSLTIIDNSYFV
jgi:hypothetical protein